MRIDDIRLMFQYNDWANRRILSAAEQVTTEQLFEEQAFSFGSIHGTLVHNLFAERLWRVLLATGEFTAPLDPQDYPDLATLAATWAEDQKLMWRYLNTLRDDDMDSLVVYTVAEGKRERVLWQCLWHVVNHGMQHRSECAVMLTNAGASPGELDVTAYLNER
ncbi:MAG: DinB family protein [Chloroflexota bacterium]